MCFTFARKLNISMPGYADIYVLGSVRTEQSVEAFLEHFLPSRIESAGEYEISQYSESPTVVYTTAFDLIRHCSKNLTEIHAIYWHSDSQPEHAMVFYLHDGGLIFGVSTPYENSQRVDQIATDLGAFFYTDEVIVTYEALPPASVMEFRALFHSLSAHLDETSRQCRGHKTIKGKQAAPSNDG
jgi:hypothetical protein